MLVGYEIGKIEVYQLGESLGTYGVSYKGSSNGRSYGNGGSKIEVYSLGGSLGAYGGADTGLSNGRPSG